MDDDGIDDAAVYEDDEEWEHETAHGRIGRVIEAPKETVRTEYVEMRRSEESDKDADDDRIGNAVRRESEDEGTSSELLENNITYLREDIPPAEREHALAWI